MTSTPSSPVDPVPTVGPSQATPDPSPDTDLVCAGCGARLADRVSRRLAGLVTETLCSRCSRPSYLGAGQGRR